MNDINELRKVLFDTLRGLRDRDSPMDLDRAKAINETSQSIINSLKVEVDHMKITGGKGSGFIPASAEPAPVATIPQPLAKPVATIPQPRAKPVATIPQPRAKPVATIPQPRAKPMLDQKIEKLNDAGNRITHKLI